MDSRKLLAALSYFSIMFAGFIFPLVVYFISEDKEVKAHAKSAFLSHLIPLIPVPFVIIAAITNEATTQMDFPFLTLAAIIASVIISFIVLIWNIVRGIKVLSKEEI